MSFSLPDIAGTIGVALIVLTYVLLQTERLRSDSLAYSLINGIAAALILVSLWFDPNLPSVVVESFWLLISIYGIIRYVRKK